METLREVHKVLKKKVMDNVEPLKFIMALPIFFPQIMPQRLKDSSDRAKRDRLLVQRLFWNSGESKLTQRSKKNQLNLHFPVTFKLDVTLVKKLCHKKK